MGVLDIFWIYFILTSIQPIITQKWLEASRVRMLKKIETSRGSRAIALIHRQETMSLLGFPIFRYINIEDSEEVLRAIKLTDKSVPIDLIIHTPGGLVLAARQIAHALKNHPAKVTVMVPHYAMSGGTLLALAADEIVMDPNAVLGPVDPQLGEYPAASILKAVAQKDKNKIDDETLILADVSEKAIEQLKSYVREILKDKMGDGRAEEMAVMLSTGKWTHDYPLTNEEVKELGLPVSTDMPENVYLFMELFPQPNMLERLLAEPRRPLHAILGGKLSMHKLLLAEEIARRSENMFVAGELCIPFLIAKGRAASSASVTNEMVRTADRMLTEARENKRDITAPVDFTVTDKVTFERLSCGERFIFAPPSENVKANEIEPGQIICDIGEVTRWSWSDSFGPARTIFWHGPLGICELEPFAEGTRFLSAEFVNRTLPALRESVVCGSSLVLSLSQMRIATERIARITAAGQAMLHYFAGRGLPAADALNRTGKPWRDQFRILIPLDGSEGDISAVHVAAEMATRKSEIFLLHTRRGPDEERYPDLLLALSEAEVLQRRVESERIFAQANAVLALRGLVSAEQVAAQGEPAEITLRYANRMRAGLIVVAAKGASEMGDARRVIDHATCAMLVAQGRAAAMLAKTRGKL